MTWCWAAEERSSGYYQGRPDQLGYLLWPARCGKWLWYGFELLSIFSQYAIFNNREKCVKNRSCSWKKSRRLFFERIEGGQVEWQIQNLITWIRKVAKACCLSFFDASFSSGRRSVSVSPPSPRPKSSSRADTWIPCSIMVRIWTMMKKWQRMTKMKKQSIAQAVGTWYTENAYLWRSGCLTERSNQDGKRISQKEGKEMVLPFLCRRCFREAYPEGMRWYGKQERDRENASMSFTLRFWKKREGSGLDENMEYNQPVIRWSN